MAALKEYKCPCCGGAIAFDSEIQKLKCPFCDTEFEMESLKSYDDEIQNEGDSDFSWDTQAGGEWGEGETDGIRSFLCKSCGGEIIGDANTAATSCPYCGNPVVMMGQFSGDLKPDFVIPFKLNKEAAKEKFKKHLSGKKLLPKMFYEENHIEEIKGVYVPFWLFDADANAHIRYKATKVTTSSDTKYEYKRTDYYTILRGGKISFDKVPVDGSSKMDDTLMESLEPFKFKDAVAFQTAFLAGYLADKYDVDAQTGIERANARVKNSTEDAFRATVSGYDSVETENSVIKLSNGVAKYALYPVWLLNTTWKGQKYVFAMNGQTGKFVGNLPMDKSLYKKYFFKAFGISFVLIMIVEFILHAVV